MSLDVFVTHPSEVCVTRGLPVFAMGTLAHTRRMNEPVSLPSKLKAICDAGMQVPPFPYAKVPAQYTLDIGDVPRLAHRPAGDPRAQRQRIETWVRDVHETWKRLPA